MVVWSLPVLLLAMWMERVRQSVQYRLSSKTVMAKGCGKLRSSICEGEVVIIVFCIVLAYSVLFLSYCVCVFYFMTIILADISSYWFIVLLLYVGVIID